MWGLGKSVLYSLSSSFFFWTTQVTDVDIKPYNNYSKLTLPQPTTTPSSSSRAPTSNICSLFLALGLYLFIDLVNKQSKVNNCFLVLHLSLVCPLVPGVLPVLGRGHPPLVLHEQIFLFPGLLRWLVDQAKLHGSSSGNLLIAGDGRCWVKRLQSSL